MEDLQSYSPLAVEKWEGSDALSNSEIIGSSSVQTPKTLPTVMGQALTPGLYALWVFMPGLWAHELKGSVTTDTHSYYHLSPTPFISFIYIEISKCVQSI